MNEVDMIAEVMMCKNQPEHFFGKYAENDHTDMLRDVAGHDGKPVHLTFKDDHNACIFNALQAIHKAMFYADVTVIIYSHDVTLMGVVGNFLGKIDKFMIPKIRVQNNREIVFENHSTIKLISHPSGACGLDAQLLIIDKNQKLDPVKLEEFEKNFLPVLYSGEVPGIAIYSHS